MSDYSDTVRHKAEVFDICEKVRRNRPDLEKLALLMQWKCYGLMSPSVMAHFASATVEWRSNCAMILNL